jgi:hypothetical protein
MTELSVVLNSTEAVPDEWDVDALRLRQDFAGTAGVKKVLLTVPCRKPSPQAFIRVHPDKAFRNNFSVVILKDERDEIYLVPPALAGELTGELASVTLYTCIDRQGAVFLWPIKLPGEDGKVNEWHRSAREIAEIGMGQWVRVTSDRGLGAYVPMVATGILSEPAWPEGVNFADLIRLAFRDRRVDSFDHAIVKRLFGR